jgi:hypothetical protein
MKCGIVECYNTYKIPRFLEEPLMMFYRIVGLWGNLVGKHTHTHTHIYIYIYNKFINKYTALYRGCIIIIFTDIGVRAQKVLETTALI